MKFNPKFAKLIKSTRESFLAKRSHTRKLIYWEENHRLRDGPGKALVFIIPTRGCSWAMSQSGGCSICGYLYDNPEQPDFEKIVESFDKIIRESIQDNQVYSIKLFTSGSILDSKEMPRNVLKAILSTLKKYNEIEEVVLESRPEYITDKVLEEIDSNTDISKIEIAIGLESANNKILKDSINKGFLWEDFKRVVPKILDKGAKVKAYLLFKPPFVSEYDSIVDIMESVEKCILLDIDTVSINSISIHRGTFLSELFDRRGYRTPWLRSLTYLCKQIKMEFPSLRVICDPVSGGNERGAHNCGDCDKSFIDALKEFTLTQDIAVFNNIQDCSCKSDWKSYLIHEKISNKEVILP